MFNKIRHIEILPDYIIEATFVSDVVKLYDFKKLIQTHNAFMPLSNEAMFKTAKIDCGGYGLCWTDEIDIDASEIWYNGVTRLNSNNDIFNYLKIVAEETNPDYIIKALDEIAKIRGMANVAQQMGIGRESLYKSLGGKSKPLFETIYKTLQALGYQLTIKPRRDES